MQRPLLLLLAGSLAALPVAAQTGTPAAPATLDARMQAFFRVITEEPNDALAAFFPRRGDWTWVLTLRDERGRGERTGTWRFPGAETPRAIGEGGPACESFDAGGGMGPTEGRFGMQTQMHQASWRRVRGNRFVPPGASAASPVFVEWRREDGQWVVSVLGDTDVYFPRVLGRPVARGPFSRDTVGVPENAAFAPSDWYILTVNGLRYLKYGNQRPLNEADRARLVSHRPVPGGERLRCAGRSELARPRIPVHGAWPRSGVRGATRALCLPVGHADEIRNSCPAVKRGAS